MRGSSIAVVLCLAFAACGSGGDETAFCDSIVALNTFDRETATVEDMRGLVDDLVEAAPDEIADEAVTFGEGMQDLTAGDFASAADPAFEAAANEINDYATDNCSEL